MDNIVAYRIYQTNKNEFTVHGLFENANNQWLIINHKGEYAGFPAEINITYKTKEEAENAIQNFENSNPNFEHNIHPKVIQDFRYRLFALSPDVYTVQIKFKNDNNWYATGNDGMLTKKSFNTKLYDSYDEATQAMNSFNMKNILQFQHMSL